MGDATTTCGRDKRDNHVWARRPPLTEAVYFFDFFSLALAALARAFAASFSFFAACA